MLNLIRADLYRTRHRLYYFLMVLVPLGLIFSALLFTSLAVKPSPFQSGDGREILNVLMVLYPSLGSWMTLMIADVTFSEEYRHDTMKNVIAYGYSRPVVYFAKLLTGLILAITAALLLLAGAYSLVWAFIGGKPEELASTVGLTFRQLLYALPLWTGFLSLGLAVMFNIKNQWAGGVTYALLLLVPKQLLAFLSRPFPICGVITQFLPGALLERVGTMNWEPGSLLLCWGIGIAFTALTAGIGLALFSRREIK